MGNSIYSCISRNSMFTEERIPNQSLDIQKISRMFEKHAGDSYYGKFQILQGLHWWNVAKDAVSGEHDIF